jgi:hypothetical protein
MVLQVVTNFRVALKVTTNLRGAVKVTTNLRGVKVTNDIMAANITKITKRVISGSKKNDN